MLKLSIEVTGRNWEDLWYALQMLTTDVHRCERYDALAGQEVSFTYEVEGDDEAEKEKRHESTGNL